MNVTDEQPVTIDNATLNITFINNLYNTNFTCTEVVGYGGGEYRCARNTSTINAGLYNMSIVSNKTYYNNGNFLQTSAFYVESTPQLTALNVSSHNGSDAGGWGETWTFTVNVTDEDQDNVTVYLKVKNLIFWSFIKIFLR